MRPRLTLAPALERLQALAADDERPRVIVGGAVRDALLGRAARDVDIAGPAAGAFAAAAGRLLGVDPIAIDREHLGVYRLPLADGAIDIVQMQGHLGADLARRDLTINALALPLSALPEEALPAIDRAAVIDQHHGLADLDAGTVRFTSPRVVAEDPLRVLRAVRIATELDFSIDPDSERLIAAAAPQLAEVAAERVGMELTRLFACPRSHWGVSRLDATGLVEIIFPELMAGHGVEQRPNHIADVYRHQLAALAWQDLLLREAPPSGEPESTLWTALWRDAPWADVGALRDQLSRQAVSLRLATLLHDVGKPATRTEDADGRTRFFGHAELGAEIAGALCRRWRLPGGLTRTVELLVAQHLRPGQVAAPGQPPTTRALFRFHRNRGDTVAPLCWLFLADSLATVGGPSLRLRWPGYVEHVRAIIEWTPPPVATGLRSPIDGHAVSVARPQSFRSKHSARHRSTSSTT